jgi:hypothetical protein
MRPENLSKMVPYEKIIIQHHELRKALSEFLIRWNWEAHITLSFYRSVDSGTAIKDTKFLLKYCKSKFKKMKVAGVILFAVSPAGSSHIHLLLTSDQRYPQTLGDHDWHSIKSPTAWIEYYWRYWKKGTCEITRGWRQKDICNYLSKPKNYSTWDADRWDVHWYRPELLKRLQTD